MQQNLKHHTISFRNAFSGLFYAFKTQPNFKIHALLGLLALVLAYFLVLSIVEFLIILILIILVFAAEMVNTALESATDLLTSNYSQQAKIAKDVSAGMVLLTSLGATIVGVIIFSRYLFR